MTLEVIGASLGRTGTASLRAALELVGIAPCYNMREVIQHPEYVPLWQAATDGEPVEWESVFQGYVATVAYPAAYFWRELTTLYPEAKVILTMRDPERWYESVYNTIYWGMMSPAALDVPNPGQVVMARKLIFEKTFAGRFEDRAHAIRVFEQHNEDVQRSIPADRLLVYEVAEGWEPLCQFLQRPIPPLPFPKVNTLEEFQARTAARRAAATGPTV